MSVRRGRPPQYDRETLLAGAAQSLLARGVQGLRYSDVAEATGAPVASLRTYFPTVVDLRNETLGFLVRQEYAALKASVEATPDPWERLRVICEHSEVADVHGPAEEWVLWLEYFRTLVYDQDLKHEFTEILSGYSVLVRQALVDGVAAGSFDPPLSLDDSTATIVALIDGAGMRLALETEAEAFDRASRRTLAAVRVIVGLPAEG